MIMQISTPSSSKTWNQDSEEEKKVTISALPLDILNLIFLFLPPLSLSHVQRVCKKWNPVGKKILPLNKFIKLATSKPVCFESNKPKNFITSLDCYENKVIYTLQSKSLTGESLIIHSRDLLTHEHGKHKEAVAYKYSIFSLFHKILSNQKASTEKSRFNFFINHEKSLVAMALCIENEFSKEEIRIYNSQDSTLFLQIPILPCEAKSRLTCKSLCFSGNDLIVHFKNREEKQISYLIDKYKLPGGTLVHRRKFLEKITKVAANTKIIALGHEDEEISLLNAETLEKQQTLQILDLNKTPFKPDSSTYFKANFKSIQIHDNFLLCLSEFFLLNTVVPLELAVIDLESQKKQHFSNTSAFTYEKNYLFLARFSNNNPNNVENRIEIWDMKNATFFYKFPALSKVESLCLDSSGEYNCLAAALENGQVQVWSISSLKKEKNTIVKVGHSLKDKIKKLQKK